MLTPQEAYMYVKQVNHEFFSEDKVAIARSDAEPIIATDAMCSYFYAIFILGNRFHAGEAVIFESEYAQAYCTQFGIKFEEAKVDWNVEGF